MSDVPPPPGGREPPPPGAPRPPQGRRQQVIAWIRRHPLLTAAIVIGGLVAALVGVLILAAIVAAVLGAGDGADIADTAASASVEASPTVTSAAQPTPTPTPTPSRTPASTPRPTPSPLPTAVPTTEPPTAPVSTSATCDDPEGDAADLDGQPVDAPAGIDLAAVDMDIDDSGALARWTTAAAPPASTGPDDTLLWAVEIYLADELAYRLDVNLIGDELSGGVYDYTEGAEFTQAPEGAAFIDDDQVVLAFPAAIDGLPESFEWTAVTEGGPFDSLVQDYCPADGERLPFPQEG